MTNSERKIWLYWFALLLVLFVFFACSSKRVLKETNTKSDSLVTTIDTKTNIKTTPEIKDSSSVKLPVIKTGLAPDCDSICNEKCDDLLSMLNFYKKIGDNYSQQYYDREKRLYSIVNFQKAQIDSLIEVNTSIAQKSIDHKIIEVNKLTAWQYWLIVSGIICPLIILLMLFRKLFN